MEKQQEGMNRAFMELVSKYMQFQQEWRRFFTLACVPQANHRTDFDTWVKEMTATQDAVVWTGKRLEYLANELMKEQLKHMAGAMGFDAQRGQWYLLTKE